MRVIGTAGHVDHGKSSLVRALSGIDPDRLKEEKARGMTIDLGFAWVTLPAPSGTSSSAPSGEGVGESAGESVGIIDVPGHIDFIKNMLAGVGGIDAALLVIAADEGVMPQTREHLAILDLLAIPAAVVALTKVDLVEDLDWLELVELEISALLELTRLRHAPIVPVSATTGAGLNALRRALAAALDALPPRRDRARPRLPIDRSFTLTGFGTVVTGTLLDGSLAVGDTVTLLPGGLSARVRGLQTHKQSIQVGHPGSRVAVNLGGIDADQVRRGDVVAKPGSLEPTLLVDARVRLLADAPAPLKHNTRVELFTGAAELPARLRVLGDEAIAPGAEGWAQLRLERQAVVVAGDRFILRLPSPSATVGGGVILSPQPRRRWKRFDPAVLRRFATLANGAPDDLLLVALGRTPFLTARQLTEQSELPPEVAQAALADLTASGGVIALPAAPDPLLLTLDGWNRIAAAVQARVADFHRQTPLRSGIARGELRSRLQAALGGALLSPKLFNLIVERAQADELIEADDAAVRLRGYEPPLTPAQRAAVEASLAAFAAAPATPPNAGEALALLGGSAELLEMLVEQGQLVRLGGDVLFRPGDLESMMARVQDYLRTHGTIAMAQARDLLGTSRKYVQPLLEEMDARRITRRDGDLRVLR